MNECDQWSFTIDSAIFKTQPKIEQLFTNNFFSSIKINAINVIYFHSDLWEKYINGTCFIASDNKQSE